MSKLSTATRKAMPRSEFALPGGRFPIEDATHQRMAISGATRAEHAGNISPEQAAKVKRLARAMLKK